jgi:hypothetical protein
VARQRSLGLYRVDYHHGALHRAVHSDLMTVHHDLCVLGRLAAAEQRQPAEDPDHDQVEQAKGHRSRSCRNQHHPTQPQVTVSTSARPDRRLGPGRRPIIRLVIPV